MHKITPIFTKQAINPQAPDYTPELWNDGSDYAYSITINAVIPDFARAFKDRYRDLTPSTVSNHLRLRAPNDLAQELNVSITSVNHARNSIRNIMSCVQYSTSCYSYSVDDPGPFPWGFKAQPGHVSGLIRTDNARYTPDELIEKVEADGAEYCGLDSQCDSRDEGYKIGLFLREDQRDFHFIRMDSNGMGSHKLAHGAVTNRDYSGKLITNPLRADFGNYTKPVGFFIVPEGGLFVGIPYEKRTTALVPTDEPNIAP